MNVRYSYLPQQFADIDDLFLQIRKFVPSGDFTLGAALKEFEANFCGLIGVRHAVGVGSGTDALKLGLKALGIGPDDEVITAANTFIATVGAIHEVGATPVFVDCNDTFCMDVSQIEAAVTGRTKAIMPVHFTGYMADMPKIMDIATHYSIPVVEDACQAILASIDGKVAGTWGVAAGFSLHPLKNLNVWGDGGIVVTDDDELAKRLRLLRNHGLAGRDEVVMMGYNSRLDTLQAIVGNWLVGETEAITENRIKNAEYYDRGFAKIDELVIPPRSTKMRCVYHLYCIFAEDRDGLYNYCKKNGIECKIHYPIPLYRQAGLKFLGYRSGDFPVADRHSDSVISFPVDQHLEDDELDYVISTVRDYYN